MTASPEDLFAYLDDHAIAHRTHWHEAVFTVDEGLDLKAAMPGIHTKNLFLKDKDGGFILISAEAHAQIALNQLHRHIGTKRLSFGSPEDMLALLGVTPGSVTAFALMNDTARKVRFIADAALFAADPVNFHPLTNTATTAISRDDFRRFVESTGRDCELFDFASLQQVP
ncbi:prolyl-tRNA synthetase associated domain-containing protein [Hyphomonas sp.]|uniref:prolyl-tRNA synthetase associated domain-containing protein n=1 Tax=Hyphomonas sp. TaxID=87 RepID=UPI0032EEEE5D